MRFLLVFAAVFAVVAIFTVIFFLREKKKRPGWFEYRNFNVLKKTVPGIFFLSIVTFVFLLLFAMIPAGKDHNTQEYTLGADESGMVITLGDVKNEDRIRGTVEVNKEPKNLDVSCKDVKLIQGSDENKIVMETTSWKANPVWEFMTGSDVLFARCNKATIYIDTP